MKRTGLITILHKRPRLTEVFMDYYEALAIDGVTLTGVLAYSEEADLPDLRFPMWTMAMHPNSPRADKWNAAARLLNDMDVGGAFVIGSDDFLSPAYMKYVLAMATGGKDYITPNTCTFFDAQTGRAGTGVFDRLGAGRYLSRTVLEACDYEPWLAGSPRNSDHALGRVAGRIAKPTFFDNSRAPVLDVKTGINIWTYDYLRRWAVARHAWTDMPAGVFPDWVRLHLPALDPERLYDLVPAVS